MNKIELKKNNKAFQNAKELLHNRVNFFDIYPSYFLNLLKEINEELYLIIEKEKYEDIELNYKNIINNYVEIYLQKLDDLKLKASTIANINNYFNELLVIQYIMSDNKLIALLESLKSIEIESNIKVINQYFNNYKDE